MLAAKRRAETANEEITTRDGARACVERHGEVEVLTVRDRVGRVLFEYDAASGRGTLVMPEGDLRIAAPRGSIELHAAHGIRAVSEGEIALEGESVRVSAAETDLSLGESRARATSLRASVEDAELTFGTLLRSAGRVIDQAENLYQRVSDLCEIKAGRLRTLVRGGMWMKGEDVTLLAQKDVRVDGEHINLG